MNKISQVKYLVVHCSATPPNLDWGVDDIRRLHQTAFAWKDVGYHYVIKRDGTVEKGRPDDTQGAHVKGYNEVSLGVCLVGGVNYRQEAEFNFTDQQMESLEKVITKLLGEYPSAYVLGHRDFPKVDKACPCFDVKAWCEENSISHNQPKTGLKFS